MTDLAPVEVRVPDPPVEPWQSRSRLKRFLFAPETGVLIALIVITAAFAIAAPERFATIANLRDLAANASILVILAVATTFLIISGNLDLSIGSVLLFSQVVGAKVMIAVGGDSLLTVLIGLVAALGCGFAWGLLNGFLVAHLRIPPLIVTLATMGIALGGAQLISRGVDIATVPPGLVAHVGIGTLLGIPVLTIVAAIVAGVGAWVLVSTRYGRHTYASGSDAAAAARAGIPVRRHVVKTFAFAGLMYGLAGYLDLALFATTSIGGHNADALNAITAVALGGTSLFGGVGSILGTLIGVFIPSVLQNGLIIVSVPPFWQQIAVGIALLAAVYADQLRRRAQRRQ
jgi:ribose transport system permease protein